MSGEKRVEKRVGDAPIDVLTTNSKLHDEGLQQVANCGQRDAP